MKRQRVGPAVAALSGVELLANPTPPKQEVLLMKRYLIAGIALVFAALAVASAQAGKPRPLPDLYLTPNSADYGSVAVGRSSLPKDFTLSYVGFASTGPFATSVSPTSAGFSITADTCKGKRISEKKTCTITVQFSPTTVANTTATLTASTNGGAFAASATLTGAGFANGAPTANATSASTPAGTAKAINLSGSDPDGDYLTFAIPSGPSNGTLDTTAPGSECSISPKPNECYASVTYTPDAGYNGADSFTFTVYDGLASSTAATVSITVTSTQPNVNPVVAYNQQFYTNMGTAMAFTLTGTDANIGDQLTFEITQQPIHGTFGAITTPSSCSGTSPWTCTATVTYTPAAGYVGPDTFRYRAYDGQYYSDALGVPVKITVSPAVTGDEPWADPITRSYNANQTTTLTLTGGDPNGDALTFEIVTSVSHGNLTAPASVTCSSTTPSHCSATVAYTPPVGYFGADSFTYRTFDGVNYSVAQTYSLSAS